MNSDAYTVLFAPPKVDTTADSDEVIYLSSPEPLGVYPDKIGDFLYLWARRTPRACFLAERDARGEWQRLTYAEALTQTEAIGQSLIDHQLTVDRPLMLISGNSIETALLILAAMHVGVPAVPVSPAYSLLSKDYHKLKYLNGLVTPGMIYAVNAEQFGGAISAVRTHDSTIVTANGVGADLDFDSLRKTEPKAVGKAYDRVGPDTVAKILFTSGSTGLPKGVINTQKMLCSNQQGLAQIWPFLAEEKPVLVDWLPWHHTFGANHNFNMILRNGGTLYIDAGKPQPGQIETTVKNLREISPTIYVNVPSGYQALLPYLERDHTLRDRFFRDLKFIFYAAAALPQSIWQRLEKVSMDSLGRKVPMTSSWGSTETAPLVTNAHFPIERAGTIGLPIPGCELKLVRTMGKLEARVRGPNITPGYWKDEQATREVFDDEGYYCVGDAVGFVDPKVPEKGLVFAGRLKENFKLLTGTWADVGALRLSVIEACAPLSHDAVITGHDREELGVLIFPSQDGCMEIAGKSDAASPYGALLTSPAIVEHVRRSLVERNKNNAGSSARINKALLMAEPPSLDAGEITDKGYINQGRVLEVRADLVERLYAGGDDVIQV